MRCLVDGISHSGEGVARIEGKATFIPYAIPGETVEVKIIEEKKNFLRASLEEVITASPDRVEPPCPYFYQCGGCSYQHVDYPRQLELKRQVVADNLKRIGGIDIEVKQVMGMESPWRYRNKVEWHTSKNTEELTMGYYLSGSHALIGIDSCLLISQEMEDYSKYIKDHMEELRIPADCEVILRQSGVSQELMLIFKGTDASKIDFAKLLNYQEVASIYSIDQEKLLLHYGQSTLPEKILGIKYNVSPQAFFQVNHKQNEKLIQTVLDYAQITPTDIVLDAFCGTGSIALAVAGQAKKVVGVDSFKSAVKDAKKNARWNRIANCKFESGACEDVIPELEEKFDVVILDPPRVGCKAELIRSIAEKQPSRIVYVSCNPATLARDLGLFVKLGYNVDAVQPIDMFPETGHVETVVKLERR